MNYSFLNIFQPFVVKFIDDACIPKSCRGKYLLCINAMGIKWFEENYIKLEYGDGFVEGGTGVRSKTAEINSSNSKAEETVK